MRWIFSLLLLFGMSRSAGETALPAGPDTVGDGPFAVASIAVSGAPANNRTEAEVAEVLGTRGLKATVDASFRTVLALKARMEFVDQLRNMTGLDLDRPEVLAQAWTD